MSSARVPYRQFISHPESFFVYTQHLYSLARLNAFTLKDVMAQDVVNCKHVELSPIQYAMSATGTRHS